MKRLALIGLVLLLQACAQMGWVTPTSFDQSLRYAAAGVKAATQTCIDLLARASISVAAAADCRVKSELAEDALRAAQTASAGGDLTTAEQRLLAVNRLLAELERYTRLQGVKP